jgi:branched-chain amino acid aminotransferase
MKDTVKRPPFGSVLTSHMAVATYADGKWSAFDLNPVAPISLSPAAHVLHYASTCFEGFKAFRQPDDKIKIFRMDMHIRRMQQSARQLTLPEPDPEQLAAMVRAVINRCKDEVPKAPGALYLRPLLIGTMANIGAAATPSSSASLIVLASPVWDYFAGGMKPLRILVDDLNTRCAAHLGVVKTGGNYAAAMAPTRDARTKFNADQVLFCPGGEVQETGAANFILVAKGEIMTRSLDLTFLHGVTRDSLLILAAENGYKVTQRVFNVAEMLEWARAGEAALSGTAAILAGVGTLIHRGVEHKVGSGDVGPLTRALREQLVAIHQGLAPDRHGWLQDT